MNEGFDAAEKDAELLEDPEKVPVEGEEKKDEEKESEGEDEEELLEEKEEDEEKSDEEKSEEKEKEELPEGRISFKEIKAEYPEILKKFPDLRRVIAEESQYANIFGSVEQAREAVQNLQAFDSFGKKILEGDTKFLLTQIQDQSPEAFEKFSGNFLTSVREVHPETFAKIVTPLIKGVLRSAQNSGNEQYALAGKWIQKFLQLKTLDNEQASDPRIEQEKEKLKAERENVERERVSTFVQDTISEGKHRLLDMIKRDLDPEKVMTPKMREAAAKDILEQADELTSRDQRHMNNMNALWQRAKQAGMNREAREGIVRAYLARVKPLLPGLRQKIREDYLSTTPRKSREDNGEERKRKTHIPSSGSQGGSKEKKLDLNKIDKSFYRKHSDMDILDMKE